MNARRLMKRAVKFCNDAHNESIAGRARFVQGPVKMSNEKTAPA